LFVCLIDRHHHIKPFLRDNFRRGCWTNAVQGESKRFNND
jgi:hypothetical protein